MNIFERLWVIVSKVKKLIVEVFDVVIVFGEI